MIVLTNHYVEERNDYELRITTLTTPFDFLPISWLLQLYLRPPLPRTDFLHEGLSFKNFNERSILPLFLSPLL